jgi:hypothetical protein
VIQSKTERVYDSGAMNGTQDGQKSAFALSEAGLGFTVGAANHEGAGLYL